MRNRREGDSDARVGTAEDHAAIASVGFSTLPKAWSCAPQLSSVRDTIEMILPRVILVSTGALVAGLGIVFFARGLDQADKIASVVGGLSGLVGLALSTLALLGAGSQGIRVRRTGSVVQRAAGGTVSHATTGVEMGGSVPPGGVTAESTGDIEQDGSGDAVTGVRK